MQHRIRSLNRLVFVSVVILANVGNCAYGQSITYAGAGFTEVAANNGLVTGAITASLSGDRFASGSLAVGIDVTLGNVPPGFMPSLTNAPAASVWTGHSAAGANEWASVTYGNGQFVAVAIVTHPARSGRDTVMTSPDGVTWTSRGMSNTSWDSLTYGNGLFVGTTRGPRIITSPDGVTWTARSTPETTYPLTTITYGNGLFVALSGFGENLVMTSPDGINWTKRPLAEGNSWTSVTYGNGVFVAVANDGSNSKRNSIMTSPDSITWTARAAPELNGWRSVTYGNGLFVAVGTGSRSRRYFNVMTSPDGITWTARSAFPQEQWLSVTYGEGLFVAVSFDGNRQVMTSLDGANWTRRDAAKNNYWISVTYGDGKFVAVARDVIGDNRVMSASARDVATLALNNFATNHADADDVTDITFDFADSAFVTGPASNVNNATGPASSHRGIDFDDPPGALTLQINAASISEAGGMTTATVSRDTATTSALNVILISNDTGEATVASNVTIAAGASVSAPFNITGVDDLVIDGTQTVTFTATATATAHIDGTDDLDVNDDDDLDGDGVAKAIDNCPAIANADQADFEGDGMGNVCDLDDDGDGMPDSYEIANGLNAFNSFDRDADEDRDGFTNLEEFQFGTDPNLADADDDNNGIPDIVDIRLRAIAPIMQLLLFDK